MQTASGRRPNLMAFDALVIGGGPAGATAARLLAGWGYTVAVADRRATRAPALAESLPPTTRRLFARLGLTPALDEARFCRSTGNTSWWAGAQKRVEMFPGTPDDRGYQVGRRAFDDLLLALARRAGAQLYPHPVARVFEGGGLAHVECRPGAVAATTGATLSGRFVLDCSGRAGVVARAGLRRVEPRYRTVAIAGVWRCSSGWGGVDPTHTLVESFDNGWAWSVPIDARTRSVTVMLDARFTRAGGRAGLEAIYRPHLTKARRIDAPLAQAVQTGPLWSCDASLYSAVRYADSRRLLVGDAGSFIDPLSSFGVKKAMASAWRAAVVVNSCLKRPEVETDAVDFFCRREHQVYHNYLRRSASYFAEAADVYRHPFWIDRAQVAADSAVTADESKEGEPDETAFRRDPDVLRALDDLKAARSIRLLREPGLWVRKTPEIVGREVVMEESLVTRQLPSGVRFLGGVSLPRLMEIAGDHAEVPELFSAYNRIAPPVTLPNFLGALSVLLAKGMLRNQAS